MDLYRHFSKEDICGCVSHVWLFVTPWTVAYQAPLSMEFSRQEYCRTMANSWRRQWQPTPVLWPRKWTEEMKMLLLPWTEEPGRLQSMGSLRVRHDWATSLSLFTFMHWRRKWQPTPVFLSGESQGWRGLVGCRLWGCTELDTTEAT